MSDKKSKTTTNSEIETRLYHQRYLRAMNSPLRRKILRVLNHGKATFEELENKTGLDKTMLEWHLIVLENGFCVEKEKQKEKLIFKLTQEGKVVNYMK
ncbi:MAG: winged helix-turn-helix domain-containing protein [Candidatus Bathyarchaeota archaeon]|nr:winged helix-turn-helix domain-containing protein [Candidatus Bathyarchaeota archaeon]